MAKDPKQPSRPGRRRFLRGFAVLGGVAGVSALTGRVYGQGGEVEKGPEEPVSRGYRETEQVRTYYRKARM